jgi:hypothetical protein
MEIPAGSPQPVQLRIALLRAEIHVDAAQLHRTAHFTDGSVRHLTMNWGDVTRLVAFRRDVLTSAVVSMAVTDPANVVVLDERMDGWSHLLDFLPAHLKLAPSLSEWHGAAAAREPHSSHWTILFKS